MNTKNKEEQSGLYETLFYRLSEGNPWIASGAVKVFDTLYEIVKVVFYLAVLLACVAVGIFGLAFLIEFLRAIF